MDKIHYGTSGYPQTFKSKSAWKRLDRSVKPGEAAVASAAMRLPNGKLIEYDLWYVDQTWESWLDQ